MICLDKRAIRLLAGHLESAIRLRSDKIDNGFRLGQDRSVRSRNALFVNSPGSAILAPCLRIEFEHRLYGDDPAMRADFDDIFRRERSRTLHHRYEHFIQYITIMRIDYPSILDRMGSGFAQILFGFEYFGHRISQPLDRSP